MKALFGICAALVLAGTPCAASAAVYRLVYTSIADVTGQTSVDALLTTTPSPYDSGQVVSSITGTRNGVPIDGNVDDTAEIYPGASLIVDSFGITFSIGSETFNFYSDGSAGPLSYREFEDPGPAAFGTARSIRNDQVSLTLQPGTPAAPEPSQWALMIAGVGLAGAALRRTRQARPQAHAA